MKPETIALLDKAERAIKSAQSTLADGDPDFAASRAYYAMFYVAEALLGEKDLQFSEHGGVHGAFSRHFVRTGAFDIKFQRWMVSGFNQRMLGDYGVTADFETEDVQEIIDHAREFLEAARAYLKSS